ncbi:MULTISPECIES: alpha/beta-type small acid-soluble spore protein [unclassified Thomasclavelia]|uniref:Alpha/beta-type small acid-soluble spore protein n=1 Tax=Candidatus Erysipelatoclostridium merdavium TaxID=2838566 RepID=A0A9D2BL60_9FIRM|nr:MULTISPECIES: alpha/beta-type small acid-soluble spore protein [unclassified Thomasclavelia]OUP79108.1 spore protein [Erysipelatoclostridium sp. An173]OUQ09268.1 spore protein [Erysipelatoclostridium sp. An15]WRK54825.1 alpha/beta-type small acid-soluble spore protein [Coprobacillaceae bacterium CR2/5/TPMF4]HIX80770.1 alpha/beta-type small acid-soluble spore protein [Candidatus Erysipelatoclostridium merdavium]
MSQSYSSKNKLVVPGAQNAIDQMKYEIANEFGVNLGPDTTARANGSVGGEITKRLVEMGQKQMSSSNFNQSK